MIVHPSNPLSHKVNLSELPPRLALVVKKTHGVDGELAHGYKDIACELGIGDDGQAVKSVMWMYACAMEQLRSKTEPRCTDDQKNNLIIALAELSTLEQQVLYHRYGLADGYPMTYRKMAALFYSDLSGRKQTAIQKHTAKVQAKLAQIVDMTVDQVDSILMSMSGKLEKEDFPLQVEDTYLRRSGPTKLTVLRNLLSSLEGNETGEFLITLTPNMREVLSLVLADPNDTAADLARKFQRPKQTLKNAKTVLDIQLTSIQSRLEKWVELKSQNQDHLQTTYSDDLITEIHSLLAEVTPEQKASISKLLTPYQRNIFNLFLSPAKNTALGTEPTNGANITKHITPKNQALYLELKKLMRSTNAKEINPPNVLKALKRRIERILQNRSLKASQPSPQLETLRLLIQGDPTILERLDELDAEIIKLRLGSEELESLTNTEIAQILSKVKEKDISTSFVERHVANVYSTLGIPSERITTTKGKPVYSKKLEQLQALIERNPNILDECSLIERQIIDYKLGRDGKPRLTNDQIAEELTESGSTDISLIERHLSALYKRLSIS